jgi:hypothetical protein
MFLTNFLGFGMKYYSISVNFSCNPSMTHQKDYYTVRYFISTGTGTK